MVTESFMVEQVFSEMRPEFGGCSAAGNILSGIARQDCGGFLLLDFRKNVLFLSFEAEQDLANSEVLKLVSGRLKLEESGKQMELNSLIEECLLRKSAGSICLEKDDAGPSQLLVSTIQPRDINLSSHHGLVAVFFVKEGRRNSLDQFAQRFGFTESESRIANFISQGLRPADIADKMALSVHTVRHHIKKLYRKAGVHSQAQLTALVLSSSR